jgi:hypothetical protein
MSVGVATIQRSSPASAPSPIDWALGRLDAWLDTMRGPDGYGGPVAHWWQQSLCYTGTGRDWRYEGIIAGYLLLWERTGAEGWLSKARRAGDDLLAGQLPDGHYAASAFELNPACAGTPHEAACDAGLLMLAQALRRAGRPGWERYAACAERNLRAFYVDQLWDAGMRAFRDAPAWVAFVPNKAATACEALFLLADLTGDAIWVERYALPTLDRVIAHQVRQPGRLAGAIAQNSFGGQVVAKYFPIYIARCVPALLRGYGWSGDTRYCDAALRAMRFVAGMAGADGALPTVVYPDQRAGSHPSWIAPLGDVLRAADLLRPFGFDADLGAVEQRLLDGQDRSGGIQTASGFAAQAGGRLPELPDARDLLHVAGWCDKAFRYLAGRAGPMIPQLVSEVFERECVFGGQRLVFRETAEYLSITGRAGPRYCWRKGEPWAHVHDPAFWLH